MNNEERVILVTGATGRQGGATARHLLKHKFSVRVLVRDPNKPQAKELYRLGCEVVQGDLNDAESIRRAMEGCYGVFSVQARGVAGPESEAQQGKLLADLSRTEGVEHFVYSSVGGANRDTKIPHFESKWKIEQHIRGLGLPATILRPVFFFDNFEDPPLRDSILKGTLSLPMHPDKPLQMIAVDDIGGFAAMVFVRPRQYIGKVMELAGDELTMPETAETFSRVLNQRVEFVETPIEEMERQSPDMATMFRWFNQEGYSANIRMIRGVYPPLQTFERWLRNRNWVAVSRAKVA